MNKMKKLALSLLLAMPMVASAAGMGVYVPLSVSNTMAVTDTPDVGVEQDFDLDYKSSVGLGLAFDTNIGKDSLFNYRLGLEYMKQEIDSVDGYSCTGDCDFGTRINMVNTFGFGVLRTQTVRLWVGPRINFAYDWDTGDNGDTRLGFELGVAPAVGINVNLGRVVSLAADVDYRFATAFGAYDDDFGNSGTYTGSTTGPTARFYVLFRFGEEFQKQAPQSVDQGVVDQSL